MIDVASKFNSETDLTANRSTFQAVGEIQPWTVCSFIDDGGTYPKVCSYRSNNQIAGIVQKRPDGSCEPYKDGEMVPIIEDGESTVIYMLQSATNARTNLITVNSGIFCGTIFNMVSDVPFIPGFLLGLPMDLILDKVRRLRFVRWIDKDNYIASVKIQALDKA